MQVIVFVVTGQLKRFPRQDKARYDEEDMDHWSAGVDDADEG